MGPSGRYLDPSSPSLDSRGSGGGAGIAIICLSKISFSALTYPFYQSNTRKTERGINLL